MNISSLQPAKEGVGQCPQGLELNPFIYLGVTDLAAAEIRATEVIGTLTLSLEP